jgi:hypothetical protein
MSRIGSNGKSFHVDSVSQLRNVRDRSNKERHASLANGGCLSGGHVMEGRLRSEGSAALWIFALLVCSLGLTSQAFAQAAGCQITYTKSWEGGTGFGANLAILNSGPAITNGWTLQFTFANGERIQNGWPVTEHRQRCNVYCRIQRHIHNHELDSDRLHAEWHGVYGRRHR